jgi:monoamine oxidase
MQQLARGCADVIHFGAVVQRIDWRDGAVAVTFHEAGDAAAVETLTARAAVITVPLPLLQARELCIEPEPAAVRRALDDMRMGSVVRVSLLCREPFWEDDVIPAAAAGASLDRLSFLHTPRGAFDIWWTSHPLRAPVLVGWSGGPPARALARTGNVEVAAITALAGALGLTRRRLERMVEAVFTHDWDDDAYSRGAYSYVRAGGHRAPSRLARPVKRTLFFAGEATARNDSGTVEGALVSADRAVQQVLRALP